MPIENRERLIVLWVGEQTLIVVKGGTPSCVLYSGRPQRVWFSAVLVINRVSVLIFRTLIHKLVLRNKRDVNPSSVSVTRFIRSKFSR